MPGAALRTAPASVIANCCPVKPVQKYSARKLRECCSVFRLFTETKIRIRGGGYRPTPAIHGAEPASERRQWQFRVSLAEKVSTVEKVAKQQSSLPQLCHFFGGFCLNSCQETGKSVMVPKEYQDDTPEISGADFTSTLVVMVSVAVDCSFGLA